MIASKCILLSLEHDTCDYIIYFYLLCNTFVMSYLFYSMIFIVLSPINFF